MSRDLDDLFDRARAVPIDSIVPTKLRRAGSGKLRGECPLCHSGQAVRGQKAGTHFSVDVEKNLWYCFGGCSDGGDAIELEHRLNSAADETRLDAARRLARDAFPGVRDRPKPAAAVRVPDETPGWTLIHAQTLWREAVPAAGTVVQRYLISRGIHGWVLKEALRHLRFHPMAYHSGPSWAPIAHPAMLLRVFAPDGPTGGVHATYLRADGKGKADIPDRSSKVMWGPQSRAGLPGAGWLSHPERAGPLVEGEGIESTLSAACLRGEVCRMVATLALDRMQGGWLADVRGHKDPDCPRPDPSRPGFTWPEAPAAPWGKIVIAVDHDMSPLNVKVRAINGRDAIRTVTGEERARICGTLAQASWRRTTDTPIEIMVPPAGQDWNDVLKETIRE